MNVFEAYFHCFSGKNMWNQVNKIGIKFKTSAANPWAIRRNAKSNRMLQAYYTDATWQCIFNYKTKFPRKSLHLRFACARTVSQKQFQRFFFRFHMKMSPHFKSKKRKKKLLFMLFFCVRNRMIRPAWRTKNFHNNYLEEDRT